MPNTTTESPATEIEETTHEPVQNVDTPEGGLDQSETDADDKPGREAARYRRQLREVETERDGLMAQLEALRRAEVDQLTGAVGVRPEALWAAGTTLTDLLTEDGTIDPELVGAAVKAACSALGIPLPDAGQIHAQQRAAAIEQARRAAGIVMVNPTSFAAGNVGSLLPTEQDSPGFAKAFQPHRG